MELSSLKSTNSINTLKIEKLTNELAKEKVKRFLTRWMHSKIEEKSKYEKQLNQDLMERITKLEHKLQSMENDTYEVLIHPTQKIELP
jgi:hypothetical protein